jgi:hypothetical protein
LEKRQEGGTLAKTEVQPPLHHKISLKHKDWNWESKTISLSTYDSKSEKISAENLL